MIIMLTEQELAIAKYIAEWRQYKNRLADVANAKVSSMSDIEINADGMAAEMAVAKAINAYPDLSVEPRSGGYDLIGKNGMTIDVKYTRHRTGNLITTPKKSTEENGAEIFILVTGDPPTFDIVGWCRRGELFVPENVKDLGYGDTYVLDRSKLHMVPEMGTRMGEP